METLRKMVTPEGQTKDPQAEKMREETEKDAKSRRRAALDFNLKPKDVKRYLDRFVIKQEEAKRELEGLASRVLKSWDYGFVIIRPPAEPADIGFPPTSQ